MRVKLKSLILACTIGVLLISSACQHEPDILGANPPIIDNNCNTDTVYFRTEVLPLLVSSCAVTGCHDVGGESFTISDYASIIDKVKPGKASKSELYKIINRSIPELRMPPAPRQPLSQAYIAKVEKWINQGAINNVCNDDNCDTLAVSFSSHIYPVVQNYCQGCHSGNAPSGDLKLTSYGEIVNSISTGKFLGSIQHLSGYKAMPKNSDKLSDCKIRQFEIWIDAGTPEN